VAGALFIKLRGLLSTYPARYAEPPAGFPGTTVVERGARKVIGRDRSAGIVVPELTVSRFHAAIDGSDGETFVLADEASTSGTWLNAHRVVHPTVLVAGDEIRVGQVLFLVHEAPPPPEGRSLASWAADLDARERDRRWAAAEALASFGDRARGAVAALLRALDDEHPAVRRYAAKALGLIGHDLAIAPLVAHLGDRDDRALEEIARALGRFEERAAPAIDGLVRLLHRPGVARFAASTLARIGPPAFEALHAALRADNTTTLVGACDALGHLGDAGAPAVQRLVGLAGHPQARVRRHAIRALGRIGAPAAVAVPMLLELLDDDRHDATLRRRAAQALGHTARGSHRESRAVAALTRALDDRDLAGGAAEGLAALGPAARVSVSKLERLAKGGDGLLAAAARHALLEIG
jgi:HEAT repeat protein